MIKSGLLMNIVKGSDKILEKYVGQSFKVHNGIKYSEVYITNEMVNRKFGEFLLTRNLRKMKNKKKK